MTRGASLPGQVVTALLLLAGACAPGAAAAQSGLRVGVPADGLAPGLVRVDVAVPEHAEGAVTLLFAEAPQATPVVSVAVRVAPDAATASSWLAMEVDSASGGLPVVPGLGDEAFGMADLLAFRRLNVALVVRGVAGRDVRGLARHLDDRVAGAPAGSPAARPVPAWEVDLESVDGNGAAVTLPPTLVAGRLRVEGPGYARRTRNGWRVVRTAPGPLRVRTVRVDPLLRVAVD